MDRQFRGHDEQLALQAQDEGRQIRQAGEPAGERRLGEEGPDDAEAGDGLVDRAVGVDPRVILGDPVAPEQETGRSVVAATGRDDAPGDAGTALTRRGRRRADPSARREG
jgi:hypothetical protein